MLSGTLRDCMYEAIDATDGVPPSWALGVLWCAYCRRGEVN